MKTDLLNNLYENRLLIDSKQYETFESSLASIVDVIDENDIPSLCNILDDSTENEEALFGVVHLMEKFSSLKAFELTLIGLRNIEKKSPRWTKIILYRCLNDAYSRKMIKEAIKEVDIDIAKSILQILETIKNENPQKFMDKVNEILT